MVNNILSKKEEREEICIANFLNYCCPENTQHLRVPVQQIFNSPDYYIPHIKALVEIKEVHDAQANKRSSQWGKIVNELKKHIKTNSYYPALKGLYDISTPEYFKIAPQKLNFIANELMISIKQNKLKVQIEGIDFEIKRYGSEEPGIVFSTHYGGPVNPSGTIYQNVLNNLIKANNQLGFDAKKYEVNRRILLLSNQYIFGERIYEVMEAIGYAYKKLLSLKYIDEIWFQINWQNKEAEHILIYEKNFLCQFESKCLKPTTHNNALFSLWFRALERINNDHKEKLYLGLKELLQNKVPDEIFPDEHVRSSMVRLSEWLIENKKYADAIWLIEKFIHDPDPPIPTKYKGDPRFNYDRQIREGDVPSIITTVLGHLAWGIKELSTDREYIISSFRFTKELLNHQNLYVKTEALIPLIEISARRTWIRELDEEKGTNHYADFRSLVFDLLRKCGMYPAIAKRLVHVFSTFKDLTTQEALEILTMLKEEEDSAPLVIYFGIYRQRHYKIKDGLDSMDFDPVPLRKNLISILKENNQASNKLVDNITWHFWKILAEEPKEFPVIKPYIEIVIEGPYRKRAFDNIDRIIIDWIEKEPKTCMAWYVASLNKTVAFVKNNKAEARNIWLNSDQIISFVAGKYPEKLPELMDSLAYLWESGMFIGGLETIFNSYKIILNEQIREATKSKLIVVYEHFKKLNPKLVHIPFD